MLNARYFDGKTATARAVSLTLDAQNLVMRGDGFELRRPLHEVRISERMGNTPRLLTFACSGHCEVTDHAALDALLADAGVKHTALDKMHHSLRWALLAAALTLVILFAAYRYLLPWGADFIAMRMPEQVLQKMSASTLEAMDQQMLQPSKLDAARRAALTARFAALRPLPGTRMQTRILFRSAPEAGPNAFALPDGTLVLLDQLVALTKNDDEIMAVLAHERGHVERRHAVRMVLQSSAVGLVVAWYAGDVSTLLTAVPAAIMEAGYSRNMESEADEYAGQLLRQNDLSPCLLASMLDKLEAFHQKAGVPGNRPEAGRQAGKMLDYLSSHPATAERNTRLCPAK